MEVLTCALCLQSDDLFIRTGAIVFGFITQGSTNCLGRPGWFGVGLAREFVQEYFQMSMWDLLTLFEKWALGRDKSAYHVQSFTGCRELTGGFTFQSSRER